MSLGKIQVRKRESLKYWSTDHFLKCHSLSSRLLRSQSCLRNPSFGKTSLCFLTCVNAFLTVICLFNIRKATTSVVDLLIPSLQCTKTEPESVNTNVYTYNH